ncbi:ergothioneine biosynthesis protein EgtB [Metabacillus rhizolycopersici]|uniref:Ergothioneine biosynthesis protein EgtB n=1 Tax=Metabacillus rhizolycopersici TaxID=2875709 RepID=A0ABS7USX7_9BACI|nr:ergothioneine biosynthesis protein EgtB [Metabacillus rhizolycopersici]MBZ5751060.1 ergothioneine biosynthesis protein EgtB [Metabacillus rhizolycopersici]
MNKQMIIETHKHSKAIEFRFTSIRKFTEHIVEPLEIEDFTIQAIPDVSPAKWHLAHTTWFFETFVLVPNNPSYRVFHPRFDYLFNSYYETIGNPFPRPHRGRLTRPSKQEVMDYRHYVEEHILNLLKESDEELRSKIGPIIEIGLNHEQQHQELLFTDIKYNFYVNPLRPVYRKKTQSSTSVNQPLNWEVFKEGLIKIGHNGKGFSFDNESPRHKVWLESYEIASRPVTNGEFIEFIEDGGYEKVAYWLSDGWMAVKAEGWKAPLYWEKIDGAWYNFTLSGMREVDKNELVAHVSYYEADAYARWAGKRLPREAEWENAFSNQEIKGNFAESGFYHPYVGQEVENNGLQKGFGDVWEWTMSPYIPYPGNKPLDGALGEYNAKFMCNQMILRGGSCVTPLSHIRLTYRNFFQPEKRWQFSGIRLAGDII